MPVNDEIPKAVSRLIDRVLHGEGWDEVGEAVDRVTARVLEGEGCGAAAWGVAAHLELSPEATHILVYRGLVEMARSEQEEGSTKAERSARPTARPRVV